MENLKSVIYLKKRPEQSQAEYKNICCLQYNAILGEFLMDYGAYYDFYATLLDKADKDNNFQNKVLVFTDTIDPWIEMVRHVTEAPVPNFLYFRKIYYDYQNSKKSAKDLGELATRFFNGLNEVTIALYEACDKFFNKTSDNGVKILNNASPQLDFSKEVICEYNLFIIEFLIDEPYGELYKKLQDWVNQKGEHDAKLFENRVSYFLHETCNKLNKVLTKRTFDIPLPDLAYYRKLYRQCKNQTESLDKITSDFLYGIEMLSHKIDVIYNDTF